MMSRSADKFFPDDWLQTNTAVAFYRSEHDWTGDQQARNSAHFMRRAWEQLGLEAILTVEDKPTVYFKRVNRKDPTAEAELHRGLWNQGTATLLIVRDTTEIRAYSALAQPNSNPIANQDDARLVETMAQIQSALELTDFVRRVQTGRIYQQHRESFQAENGVDRTLLRNLKAASKMLCDGADALKPSVAHGLLGRLLFTCYLRARGVLSDDYLVRDVGITLPGTNTGAPGSVQQILSAVSLTQAKETLFKIFATVQRDFNGSLFGKELDGESRSVRVAHINVLRDLLNGVEMGQGALGFAAYDFSLIPIETISAIYESFLRNESMARRNETGSFYTPRHLAEMAVDIATEGWTTLLDKKFCDPSVGSGIFLVILFNRMAEEWRARNPRKTNLERAIALRERLCDNFWGVDLNPTACRITCFSLYLALFDQLEPSDIWALKKKLETDDDRVLPPLLALAEDKFQNTDTPRVLADNFFSKALPLPSDFNLVIGNPPWIGRGQERDETMEQWLASDANISLAVAPKPISAHRNFFTPDRQSACGFMWKVPQHLCADGRACLVLPTKVFMNENTNEFQAGWLNRFTVDQVVQLSDYRKLIFEEAKCPAVIVRFRSSKPANNEVVRYDTPKVDRSDPRQALITVLSEDQKGLRLDDLLAAAQNKRASVVWKQSLWGTGRDVAFLHRLSKLPTLGDIAGEPGDETKRWAKGQGFQPYCGKDEELRWWNDNHLFLDANCDEISLVVIPEDARPIGPEPKRLHRIRNPAIFKPPMVLVTQGFGKAAFCDFPVLFQHSLQSIAAKKKGDDDLLRFLAGIITSSFAKYFLFHTAANWGSERDKVHLTELLRLPFPLPENCHGKTLAGRIVEDVAQRVREAHKRIAKSPLDLNAREYEVAVAKAEIEPLVFKYFGVTPPERILIEDTVKLFIPSSTPGRLDGKIPTLDDSCGKDRAEYARQLCQTINMWGRGKGQLLSARGCIAEDLGLSLLVLTKGRTKTDYTESAAPDEVAKAMVGIEKSIAEEHRKIAYARGFTLFENDRAYVLKPLALRHWTRSAALNDADAMFAARLEPNS
jgi:hypothetical protein